MMPDYEDDMDVDEMLTTVCAWISINPGWKLKLLGDVWVDILHKESGSVFRLEVTQLR